MLKLELNENLKPQGERGRERERKTEREREKEEKNKRRRERGKSKERRTKNKGLTKAPCWSPQAQESQDQIGQKSSEVRPSAAQDKKNLSI